MAAGDLKGPECIVIKVTLGATTVKGDFCHLEADGKWDPTAAADLGKFGVALDAGGDGDTARMCVWGPVEVNTTAAAIAKGALLIADAKAVKDAGTLDATSILGLLGGTAMEAVGASGGTITAWIGLVG